MKIKLLLSAVEDLRSAADFYEHQREGLGVYFLDSLFSDVDSLLLYAGIHPIVFGHYRLLSKRFPYAVYYTTEADHVIVHRVLDLRRDPSQIRESLG